MPAGAAGLAVWEGTVSRSSADAHWSVGAAIAAVALVGVAAGRGRQWTRSAAWLRGAASAVRRTVMARDARPEPALWMGTTLWALLVAVTIGWDLDSFAHQAHSLPTLSSLVGDVTRHDWGRALVFGAWLAVGAYVALGWRRPAAPTDHARRGTPAG